jgi:hypothetical protein
LGREEETVTEFPINSPSVIEPLNTEAVAWPLHPAVVTILQDEQCQPRASVLYFYLLTHGAMGRNGQCEVQFASLQALQDEMKVPAQWKGVTLLFQAYWQLSASEATALALNSLHANWPGIARQTRAQMLRRTHRTSLLPREEKALAELFANLRWRQQLAHTLAPVLAALPRVGQQAWHQQFRQGQAELQNETVLRRALNWLAAHGLLHATTGDMGWQVTFNPTLPPVVSNSSEDTNG